jgi:tetratricopeptide (TPR) repeat protein
MWLYGLFAGIFCLLCPAAARASGPESELAEAIEELNNARGPEAYTAVRRIWAQWGVTDPELVERALAGAASSNALAPSVRAYAGFVAAHARTRRGDTVNAERQIAQLGFVDKWLVAGPFDNEGKGGLAIDLGPEAQFAEPIVDGRAYTGKVRPVRWRVAPDVFSLGWLDGGSLFRPQQNICFYASTVVWRDASTPATQPLSVWVGAAGAFRLFINGKVVLADAAYRNHDVDRSGALIRLPAGKSRVLLKACGVDQAATISLRFGDVNGAPNPNVHFAASFADTAETVANNGKLDVLKAELGPIAAFEARTSKPKVSAAELEAYARYLVASSADDPAVHQARDLAVRAAELEPSVERMLLAADLAEDYNQQRQWVSRAEGLKATKNSERVHVLLARARVEQGGLNWRDAFPYYTKALEIDPDDQEALRGRTELLNDAGLPRSSLSLLQAALARNPNSVTLLSSYAGQLRSLGRTADADVAERRYAQFRFDDHTFLSDKLDVALARGERANAEHWAERLLATHPDSLWAHAIVAGAYRKLNQPERAVAAYRTALSLAPEDVDTLRALSDLLGDIGHADEQVRLLRQVLELQPQSKDIQEYLSNIEPEKPKQDEAYAWGPEKFLKGQAAPANGESKRTLLDLNVTTVFENGLSSKFRQIVFQPLVDSAAALSRNYVFGYEADSQTVQLRGARVYRTNGRVDEAIETGVGAADDPSIAMYTSARTFSVQFPRLEPGDVVELRYRIDDVAQRNVFNDYFGDIQYLQDTDAVGHAEYVLITPKSRHLYIDQQRIPGLKSSTATKNNQQIYRFWADDLPPIAPEPSMPPWQEVLGFVHVSTYKDYGELGKWYWGLAQDQFDSDEETRRLAREIVKDKTELRDKVEAVYDWVIRNTRYVALEFGIYGFKPRRCVQTVARGWGDCKDKATVIVSLLKELGIESTIVVLRTQMRGMFSSSVASLAPFDHAIAYVPALDLFLDGTAEFTGITELPGMDQQAVGLLINQGNTKQVRLPLLDPRQSVRSRVATVDLDGEGAARVSLDFSVKGVRAPEWRRRYHAEATRRERIASDLSREFPGFDLDAGASGLSADLEDNRKPVQIQVKGKSSAFGRVEGDRLSLGVTTSLRLTSEYASLSERTLPVAVQVMGATSDTFNVKLPAGYHVLSRPGDTLVSTRFGDYSISVSEKDGVVSVKSELVLKVTRVEPKEYAEWRAFCQGFDAAMDARLVVGK